MNLNPNAIPTFLIAFALFWLSASLARRVVCRQGRIGMVVVATVLAIPGALFVLYYTHLFDNAAWFYSFRAVSHTELAAAGLGSIAGLVQSEFQPNTPGEKLIVPLILCVLLFVPFIKSALDPVDYGRLQKVCPGEVCLQSTPSTCGPTSAATLLKLFGKNASEEELARECFTYRGGTEIWYVARSLRKRGLAADFVIQPPNKISPPAPAIAGVLLPGGAGHFVAILSEDDNSITIGDPLKGKLIIPRTELSHTYHFTGFFLVLHLRRG